MSMRLVYASSSRVDLRSVLFKILRFPLGYASLSGYERDEVTRPFSG